MRFYFSYLVVVVQVLMLVELGNAQTEQVIIPSNGSTTSLEKNILFYANTRYKVTQSGSGQLPLDMLFDGSMNCAYTPSGLDANNPYVILIEDLPDCHTQKAAWVGWSTRYYSAKRFKIEAFDQWNHQWVTVAEVSNYYQGAYMTALPPMSVGKLKFTFYETVQQENLLGLSEIFFLHPEGSQAYDNLMVKYAPNGNVGIGTWKPDELLSVNGNIRAKEIKVETANWPDYVFEEDYTLESLSELEQFVKKNKHLPGVPKATDVEDKGISLGEMNRILLQKVEELTLHLIEKDKDIVSLKKDMALIKEELEKK